MLTPAAGKEALRGMLEIRGTPPETPSGDFVPCIPTCGAGQGTVAERFSAPGVGALPRGAWKAKAFRYILVAAVLFLLGVACDEGEGTRPAESGDQPAATLPAYFRPRWMEFAPMPTPRSEVGVAILDHVIYVVGGLSPAGDVGTVVEAYQVLGDTWEKRAPLPVSVNHAGVAAVFTPAGPRLYVIGGFHNGFTTAIGNVFEYDPTTDTWTEKTPMPTPRGALGVAGLDRKIYAIGGADSSGSVAATEAYDPITDTWQALAPMPTPRDHLAVAIPTIGNNKIYAIGGRSALNFNRNLDANEEYDPVTDTWTPRARLPTPRSGIAAAGIAGHIFVFGGEAGAGTFAENEAYNPAADAWSVAPPMPTARHGLGAAPFGGTAIFVIAGGTEPGLSASAKNEAFIGGP